jgi:microcystin degradation protein MlrC
VLKALVEREIGPALFGVMWDPMAFQIAEEAGEGARSGCGSAASRAR